MKENKIYNCIELFAGSGGLGTGFLNAGFNIISANDIWEPAAKTYIANHPNVRYIVKDITDLTGNELLENTGYIKEDIDVIIGGPPCQGFSTLGKRFIDDPRNKLFREYVRIVDEISPSFFVMENVLGILSMEKGKVLENIIKAFNDIHYNVEYKILNAAEFGIPQQRERVIFIGTKTNKAILYPKETHTLNGAPNLEKALTLWEAISDLPKDSNLETIPYTSESKNNYQEAMRRNSIGITNHNTVFHNEKAKKMMKYIPVGKSVWDVQDKIPKELIPTSGYGNTYARLNPDEPGMTITRNFSCISSSRCIHPYANRGLTAREAARIQSYPDNYVFLGSKTDISIQIGNSVPPLLGEKIAYTIKEMLSN
ncbi:MAG: DNA cytosine methyltransferase [Clostridia bacterium]|nr:DNA cytosine methyltransferase [Clostridia bacterium]